MTGDEGDLVAARAVQRVALTAPEAPGPKVAKTHTEKDLALFLGFQRSGRGKAQQDLLTEASKELADSVGGHSPYAEQRSTVFHRISRQLAPRPGSWLLQHPKHGARLAAAPGVASIKAGS